MMFRRIELIHQLTPREHRAFLKALGRANNTIEPQLSRFWKSGLMGFSHFGVVQAWAKINKPRRAISKNCRFYFTEEGWKRLEEELEILPDAGARHSKVRDGGPPKSDTRPTSARACPGAERR